MPTEIQTPKPWMRLAEAFRLTGRHKLQIDEVVVPVAIIADLSEKEVLLDVRAAQGGIKQAIVPTFISQSQLFNPNGSGLIFDLYRVDMLSGAGSMFFQMGRVNVPLASTHIGGWQDTRLIGAPVGQLRQQATSLITFTAFPVFIQGPPTFLQSLPLRVTLPPGQGWMIETSFVAKELLSNWYWTERAE